MPRPAYPFVKAYADRHGKLRRYFRKRGLRSAPLPGVPGSPEFLRAYEAVLAGSPAPEVEVGATRHAAGSLDAIVTGYLASKVFDALAPETKRTRRNILENFTREHGAKPVYYVAPGGKRVLLLTREHVQKIVNAKADTPSAQRNFLNTLRSMFGWAMAEGKVPDDPTLGVRRGKIITDGYKPWQLADVEQYIARHPLGTKGYLALILLLDTGQRRGDVVRMGKQHIRDGVLSIRQNKTGQQVDIPVTARLAAAIAAHPSSQLIFLETSFGHPFTVAGFTNWFRDRCSEAGLVGLSAHGLRKTRATMLAAKGRSMHQIAAVTGHKSIAEVQRYTRDADRKRLAAEAMRDEVEQTNSEQEVSNLRGRVRQ